MSINTISTATYPGTESRLLGAAGEEDIGQYRGRGGYHEAGDPAALLAAVGSAGLRGRGGAAFPLAVKMRTVVDSAETPVVLANGEEGEPASVKDRWLMRHRPHLVIDGARLAAHAVGTRDVVLYVSDDQSAISLRTALDRARAAGVDLPDIMVCEVEPGYVAGEETAAVRFVNGGPALPTEKPPRPFEAGVNGRPTLVSNVETLANLPYILRHGADGFRTAGTADSAGTFLMTLTGTANDGLYEIPFGVTLADVLNWLGDCTQVRGALIGGYFAGVLSDRVLGLPLEYGAFRDAGSGLGCGAISVLDEQSCPVTVSAAVLGYFDRENAGQCGSCFNGTAAMASAMSALARGRADAATVERLRQWSIGLRGRGACGTLDGATNVAAAVLREFGDVVAERVSGVPSPEQGLALIPDARPFAVIEKREVLA